MSKTSCYMVKSIGLTVKGDRAYYLNAVTTQMCAAIKLWRIPNIN